MKDPFQIVSEFNRFREETGKQLHKYCLFEGRMKRCWRNIKVNRGKKINTKPAHWHLFIVVLIRSIVTEYEKKINKAYAKLYVLSARVFFLIEKYSDLIIGQFVFHLTNFKIFPRFDHILDVSSPSLNSLYYSPNYLYYKSMMGNRLIKYNNSVENIKMLFIRST